MFPAKGNVFRHLRHTRPLLKILYWMPIAVVSTQYFYTVKIISGRSMQPTLNPNSSIYRDVGLFDRFSIHIKREYHRGDIVILRSPDDPKYELVKRVIALEGDVVKTLPPYPDAEVRVPRGHIWVEGDEHFRSDDSNLFGPVPMGLVDSKLTFILWPFSRFGPLREKNRRAFEAERVSLSS